MKNSRILHSCSGGSAGIMAVVSRASLTSFWVCSAWRYNHSCRNLKYYSNLVF
ncbi:hypothetical protein J7E64_02450 [Priestia megaterium]|nr:hypothetical protein [Priestia megaterium]